MPSEHRESIGPNDNRLPLTTTSRNAQATDGGSSDIDVLEEEPSCSNRRNSGAVGNNAHGDSNILSYSDSDDNGTYFAEQIIHIPDSDSVVSCSFINTRPRPCLIRLKC